MKILEVAADHPKRAFVVTIARGDLELPFAKLDPPLSKTDRVRTVYVDEELGREGFTYELADGREGTVHVDQVLDFNRDPAYLADLLLYQLTLEAEKRWKSSGLGIRQLARRLETSPSQIYRLLDTTNYRKSVRQMLGLLAALDCEVDLVVRDREAV